MLKQLRAALVVLAALSVVTGLAYPLLVTGIAQAAFPRQSNGSLIEKNGKVVGSALIGQPFSDAKYFWGRLSDTSPFPYNAASSSGSNYGPMNPALIDAARARLAALGGKTPVPVDLVTSSGSGLDPDISPAAAEYQVPRVAKARHLSEARVRALVAAHTESRTFGVLGEPIVNVLELNLALDATR
jgi:potassium-transporting ATPase KdpC subunit